MATLARCSTPRCPAPGSVGSRGRSSGMLVAEVEISASSPRTRRRSWSASKSLWDGRRSRRSSMSRAQKTKQNPRRSLGSTGESKRIQKEPATEPANGMWHAPQRPKKRNTSIAMCRFAEIKPVGTRDFIPQNDTSLISITCPFLCMLSRADVI